MIELRPFLNCDSPGIAAVWNSQPRLRGRVPTLTPAVFEQHVLSKPHFDPCGFLVAEDAGRVAGFVHAGFPPGERIGELDRDAAIISQLMVTPRDDADAIARQLLLAGEKWLGESGARELFGGECGMQAPFYLGLYGGCRLPGVLSGDERMANTLRAAAFTEHRRVAIWQASLDGFRPPVDRELMALRRQFQLQMEPDDSADSIRGWRAVCTYGCIDRYQFRFVRSSNREQTASLVFWDEEPLARGWGERTMGLAELNSPAFSPTTNEWTFFLAEAMRQFQTQGVRLFEVQLESTDEVLLGACRRLALRAVDSGIQFHKSLGDA